MMMMMRVVERSVCLTDDHVRLCGCKMKKETIEKNLCVFAHTHTLIHDR